MVLRTFKNFLKLCEFFKFVTFSQLRLIVVLVEPNNNFLSLNVLTDVFKT